MAPPIRAFILVDAFTTIVTSIKINDNGTTFDGMSGSFNSSQINACGVGIAVLGPPFIVRFEGLGGRSKMELSSWLADLLCLDECSFQFL